MKITTFPSDSQWVTLYQRVTLIAGFACSALTLFWIWHFDYTGEGLRGFRGMPRLWDGLILLPWLFTFVSGLRFLGYVHARTKPDHPLAPRIVGWTAEFFVWYLVFGGVGASIIDVGRGGNMFTALFWTVLCVTLAFLLFWWLTGVAACIRRFGSQLLKLSWKP